MVALEINTRSCMEIAGLDMCVLGVAMGVPTSYLTGIVPKTVVLARAFRVCLLVPLAKVQNQEHRLP